MGVTKWVGEQFAKATEGARQYEEERYERSSYVDNTANQLRTARKSSGEYVLTENKDNLGFWGRQKARAKGALNRLRGQSNAEGYQVSVKRLEKQARKNFEKEFITNSPDKDLLDVESLRQEVEINLQSSPKTRTAQEAVAINEAKDIWKAEMETEIKKMETEIEATKNNTKLSENKRSTQINDKQNHLNRYITSKRGDVLRNIQQQESISIDLIKSSTTREEAYSELELSIQQEKSEIEALEQRLSSTQKLEKQYNANVDNKRKLHNYLVSLEECILNLGSNLPQNSTEFLCKAYCTQIKSDFGINIVSQTSFDSISQTLQSEKQQKTDQKNQLNQVIKQFDSSINTSEINRLNSEINQLTNSLSNSRSQQQKLVLPKKQQAPQEQD